MELPLLRRHGQMPCVERDTFSNMVWQAMLGVPSMKPCHWQQNCLRPNSGNPLTIYRGLSGPPGPKPRKSLKKVSGASGPRTPESLERSRSLEKSRKGPEGLFETFSRLSGGSGAEGPSRVHVKWVVLCERTCFCLLSTF